MTGPATPTSPGHPCRRRSRSHSQRERKDEEDAEVPRPGRDVAEEAGEQEVAPDVDGPEAAGGEREEDGVAVDRVEEEGRREEGDRERCRERRALVVPRAAERVDEIEGEKGGEDRDDDPRDRQAEPRLDAAAEEGRVDREERRRGHRVVAVEGDVPEPSSVPVGPVAEVADRLGIGADDVPLLQERMPERPDDEEEGARPGPDEQDGAPGGVEPHARHPSRSGGRARRNPLLDSKMPALANRRRRRYHPFTATATPSGMPCVRKGSFGTLSVPRRSAPSVRTSTSRISKGGCFS